ncbi:MAG: DUF2179 domain-containing protein [Phycisphaerae bacterium]
MLTGPLAAFLLPDLGPTWTPVLAGVLIFVLRVVEMTIDSFRLIFIIRGKRLQAGLCGFVEAAIFITAIAQVLKGTTGMASILGYSGGFALGTYLGSLLAGHFSSDHLLVRVISRQYAEQIRKKLREDGFGVTTIMGEGLHGPLPILFVIIKRKQGKRVLKDIRAVHDKALVVSEPLHLAVNAFVPRTRLSMGNRR